MGEIPYHVTRIPFHASAIISKNSGLLADEFTGRTDLKSDADLLKAARQLLVEKVIAPYAAETSGDRPRNI